MKVTSFPSTFLALTTANLLSRRTMASFVAASSTINSMSTSPLSLHQSPYSIDQLIPRQYEPIPTAKYTLKKLVVINRHGDRAQIAKELGESYSVTPEVTKRWTELLPQEHTQQFLRAVAFTADETNPQTLRPLSPSGQVDLYTGWDFSNLPYGQLTDMGARQLMELGQRLRQNYQNHPAVVPPSLAEAASQMYCRSTNFCRTHQSLRGLLAGLFLDLNRPVDAQESPIRPVINARPRKQETLYPQADANCVAMLRRRGQIFSEDILRRAVPTYTTLKSKMQRVFRFPDGKINWLHIKEVLLCHDVHNIEPSIPLRKYVKKPENGISLSEDELVASGDVATMTWSILYNDDTLNRMAIGRFLHELLSDMSDSDGNPLKDKTMLMYSGHDSTLVPVLCALKCFDGKCCHLRPLDRFYC